MWLSDLSDSINSASLKTVVLKPVSQLIIKETPLRLILSGRPDHVKTIAEQLKYRPESYYMAPSYQLWRQHQGRINGAIEEGNLALAEGLKARRVGWDGWKTICHIEPDGSGWVLRGLKAKIKDLVERLGIDVEWKLIPNPFHGITEDDIPDNLLVGNLDAEQWAMQKRCIWHWLNDGVCRAAVSVGGGKTAMFCAAMAAVKRRFPKVRFLYLTPSERLVKQVTEEAKKFLPSWDISQFGGKGRDDSGKDLVVATVAILNARFKKLKTSGWLRSFAGLCIDEDHYSLSPSWDRVLMECTALYRFAASDTTRESKPGTELELTARCGPIMDSRIETSTLISMDRLATPTINVIHNPNWRNKFAHLGREAEIDSEAWALLETGWASGIYKGPVFEIDENGDYKVDKKGNQIVVPNQHAIEIGGVISNVESRWALLERLQDRAIIRFKERNAAIAQRVGHYHQKKLKTLVVATRTVHLLILQSEIAKLVPENLVRILFSSHSPDERDETLDWIRHTPGAVLISPLVKVGVSLPELQAGVIADPVSDWEYARQLMGRLIRRKPDGSPNEAEISWIYDSQHPNYARNFKRIIKHLQEIEGCRFKNLPIDLQAAGQIDLDF